MISLPFFAESSISSRPSRMPSALSRESKRQEDKTQEKLKEKQGVVVRGKKNW